MSSPVQRRPEARWRCYFRRLRIFVLLAVLAVIGALLYLDLVGLPDFLRRPLLAELRARGLDLQVARLRWSFFRGIVAADVKFGRAGDATGPRFTAREAELNLNFAALAGGRIEIRGVGLRDGRVTVPAAGPADPARVLAIENVRADLRLLPDDVWLLEDFHAGFAGADFFLNGAITNASVVRDWPVFRAERVPDVGAEAVQVRLRKLADLLEQIRFTQPPKIRAVLNGDARDLESFALRLTIAAPDADTPWGRFADGLLTARLRPAAPIERPQAALQFHAGRLQTPWAELVHPHLELRVTASGTDTNRVSAVLDAHADAVNTRWAVVTNAQFDAGWEHSLTNAVPLSGFGALQSDSVTTRWGAARSLTLTASLDTLAHPPPADPALGEWQKLLPYALGWSLEASRFDTEKIDAEKILCSGQWTAPRLEITNLFVRFPEGRLDARADLDVTTREAVFSLESDFDIHKATPFLTEKAGAWLAKYSWEQAPHITGAGAVVLPAWTNRQPDWRGEVAPTLRLAALLTATNCAYLKVPADWVRTHVSYTNMTWRLPDLVAGRPEGTLELSHVANDRTREYWFGIHSTISPEALRPVLSTNAQRGLDHFAFSSTPVVDGGVWGRWRDHASIAFTGRVALADFTFRDQTVGRFESALRYTNRFLEFHEPRLERGTQSVHGAGVAADFAARRVYFTNVISTTEPLVVTRAIGPKTTAALEPYIFHEPPTVRVNGFSPLGGSREADLIFDVDGGPFEWRMFHIPRIAGRVHWRNDDLTLTDVRLRAYDGTGAGAAWFDLGPNEGTPFQFTLGVTNVDLKALMADVATRTNQLEGRLDGLLVVTNAYGSNAFTWNGHGRAALRDGQIWSIPIFGILSKPLDTVLPGLGSARISDGTAPFSLTNGVIYSDQFEMRAPTTRLQYVGTVDFAGQVNARVQAEPLRDTWVIGPLFRVALWPVTKALEFKLTGTLGDPKAEPLYLPGLIFKPLLHPFRTIEEIFAPAPNGGSGEPKFTEPP